MVYVMINERTFCKFSIKTYVVGSHLLEWRFILMSIYNFSRFYGKNKQNYPLSIKVPNTTITEFANTVDPDETAHNRPESTVFAF